MYMYMYMYMHAQSSQHSTCPQDILAYSMLHAEKGISTNYM